MFFFFSMKGLLLPGTLRWSIGHNTHLFSIFNVNKNIIDKGLKLCHRIAVNRTFTALIISVYKKLKEKKHNRNHTNNFVLLSVIYIFVYAEKVVHVKRLFYISLVNSAVTSM